MKIICWFQVILLEFCFFYFFRLSITCILKFEPEKFAIISIPSQDSKQGFHTGIPRGIPWGIPSGHQSIHQGFQQGFHGGFHQAIRDSIRDSNRDSMRDFIRPSEIPSGIPTGTKINSLPLTLGYHVWICVKVLVAEFLPSNISMYFLLSKTFLYIQILVILRVFFFSC